MKRIETYSGLLSEICKDSIHFVNELIESFYDDDPPTPETNEIHELKEVDAITEFKVLEAMILSTNVFETLLNADYIEDFYKHYTRYFIKPSLRKLFITTNNQRSDLYYTAIEIAEYTNMGYIHLACIFYEAYDELESSSSIEECCSKYWDCFKIPHIILTYKIRDQILALRNWHKKYEKGEFVNSKYLKWVY